MINNERLKFFYKIIFYNLLSFKIFEYLYKIYFIQTSQFRKRSKEYIDLSEYINNNYIFPEIEKIKKKHIKILDIGCGPDIFNNVSIYKKYKDKTKQFCTDKFNKLNQKIIKNSFDYFFKDNSNIEIKNFFNKNSYTSYNFVENKITSDYDIILNIWVLPHLEINEINNLLSNIKGKSKIYLFLIDFTDLYFHKYWNDNYDRKRFNFLKYSNTEWSFINNTFHYQNRLRYNDYEKIFIDNGYKITFQKRCNQLMLPLSNDNLEIKKYAAKQMLNKHFCTYKNKDLYTSKGIFILKD